MYISFANILLSPSSSVESRGLTRTELALFTRLLSRFLSRWHLPSRQLPKRLQKPSLCHKTSACPADTADFALLVHSMSVFWPVQSTVKIHLEFVPDILAQKLSVLQIIQSYTKGDVLTVWKDETLGLQHFSLLLVLTSSPPTPTLMWR